MGQTLQPPMAGCEKLSFHGHSGDKSNTYHLPPDPALPTPSPAYLLSSAHSVLFPGSGLSYQWCPLPSKASLSERLSFFFFFFFFFFEL